MAFKMTQFFSSTKGVGWTETWYLNTASMSDAVTKANNISGQRLAFLDPAYSLDWIRLSIVTQPAPPAPPVVSQIFAGPGQGESTLRPGTGAIPAPFTAILVRVTSGNGHRREWAVRGLYLNSLGPNWYVPPATGPQPGGPYETILNNNGAALLFNSTPALKPITAAAPDLTSNGLVLCTSAGHGLTTGQYITLYKMRTTPALAGKKKVIVKDANTFWLAGTNLDTLAYGGLGQFRVFTPGFDPTLKLMPQRIAERRTGRPFALLRGRSKHHL